MENEYIPRFEQGTQICQICFNIKKVHQFVVDKKEKGLKIQEHRFICEECLKKDYPGLWNKVIQKERKE